jgi:hypothetical protein
MTWIIPLSTLALYVVLILYIMSLFAVGSMADAKKEVIFNNLLANRSDNDVASSSAMPLIPERIEWTPIQPQETTLKEGYTCTLLAGIEPHITECDLQSCQHR